MSKRDELKSKICSIPNSVRYLQEYVSPEIFITEKEEDNTAYVLSDVDKINKTCKVATVKTVLDEEKNFVIINSPNIVFDAMPDDRGAYAAPGEVFKHHGICGARRRQDKALFVMRSALAGWIGRRYVLVQQLPRRFIRGHTAYLG